MLNALLAELGIAPGVLEEEVPTNVPQYLDPMSGPFTGVMPVDNSARDQARANYTGLLGQAPQAKPMPGPVNPAFRTQDALLGLGIPALLALFGGKQGAKAIPSFLQGYMGGKLGKAQQDTQWGQQKVQNENQNAHQNWVNSLNVSKAQLGFAEDDARAAETNRDQEIARRDQKQYRDEQMTDKRINAAVTSYNNAKTLSGMYAAAALWRKAEEKSGVSTAPTDEDIEAAWAQKSANARNTVYDNWQSVLTQAKKGNYGTIVESEMPRLRAMKKQMEQELALYGITDPILQDPDSELTLEAKYKDSLIKNAEGNLKARLNESEQRILESKARIQRAKERLGLEERRVGISGFNADTARMNHELRLQQKGVNDSIQKKIDEINSQIAGLQARKSDPKATTLKKREYENAIQGLLGKVEYWKGLKENSPADVKGTPSVGTSMQTTPGGVKYQFDTSR